MIGNLNILICGLMPPAGYSGGRYFSWILAEGLAVNNEVTFWTNCKPQFVEDFTLYPRHSSIKLIHERPFNKPFDVVIVIPDLSGSNHIGAMDIVHRDKSKIILINFETPNWLPRSYNLYDESLRIAKSADLILSISSIGNEYAKKFFAEGKKFGYIYPAINSLVADIVPNVPKKNQIVIITRFCDQHKGSDDIIDIINPELAGMKILLIGTGSLRSCIVRAMELGIEIEIVSGVSDFEKFRRIKESRLMVFLSHFEGFGYPPVEASYCGVPCVAYDLPVLREVNGKALHYVPAGDGGALRSVINGALNSGPVASNIGLFDSFVTRVDEIMGDL